MIKEIINKVQGCPKEKSSWREPLLATPLPEFPWQVVGTDLFEYKGTSIL